MQRIRARGRNVSWALALVLSTLPLQWAELARFSNVTFKVVHVAAGIFIVSVLASLGTRLKRSVFTQHEVLFWTLYLAYATLLLLSAWWSPSVQVTITVVARQLFYATVGFCIYLYVGTRDPKEPDVIGRVYLGAALAFVLFFAAAYLVVLQAHAPIGELFVRGVTRGSAPDLMRAMDSFFSAVGDDPRDYKKSLRAVILGLLVVLAFVMISLRPDTKTRYGSLRISIFHSLAFTALAAVVLFSLSRSVWLNVLVMLATVGIGNVIRARVSRDRLFVTFSIGLVLAIVLMMVGDRLALILHTRAVEDSAAYEGRIETIWRGFELLAQHPLQGDGAGTLFRSGNGPDIHFFFLKAGQQAGFLAIVLSLALYLTLLTYWLRQMRFALLLYRSGVVKRNDMIRMHWLVPILSFPLSRAFYTPDAMEGMLDWIPIGLVFGAVAFSRRQLEALQLRTRGDLEDGPERSTGRAVEATGITSPLTSA